MNTVTFKTNITCSGCVAKVTPFMNALAGEGQWAVNTASPDKVLTVTAPVTAQEITAALQQAGYKAQQLA